MRDAARRGVWRRRVGGIVIAGSRRNCGGVRAYASIACQRRRQRVTCIVAKSTHA